MKLILNTTTETHCECVFFFLGCLSIWWWWLFRRFWYDFYSKVYFKSKHTAHLKWNSNNMGMGINRNRVVEWKERQTILVWLDEWVLYVWCFLFRVIEGKKHAIFILTERNEAHRHKKDRPKNGEKTSVNHANHKVNNQTIPITH